MSAKNKTKINHSVNKRDSAKSLKFNFGAQRSEFKPFVKKFSVATLAIAIGLCIPVSAVISSAGTNKSVEAKSYTFKQNATTTPSTTSTSWIDGVDTLAIGDATSPAAQFLNGKISSLATWDQSKQYPARPILTFPKTIAFPITWNGDHIDGSIGWNHEVNNLYSPEIPGKRIQAISPDRGNSGYKIKFTSSDNLSRLFFYNKIIETARNNYNTAVQEAKKVYGDFPEQFKSFNLNRLGLTLTAIYYPRVWDSVASQFNPNPKLIREAYWAYTIAVDGIDNDVYDYDYGSTANLQLPKVLPMIYTVLPVSTTSWDGKENHYWTESTPRLAIGLNNELFKARIFKKWIEDELKLVSATIGYQEMTAVQILNYRDLLSKHAVSERNKTEVIAALKSGKNPSEILPLPLDRFWKAPYLVSGTSGKDISVIDWLDQETFKFPSSNGGGPVAISNYELLKIWLNRSGEVSIKFANIPQVATDPVIVDTATINLADAKVRLLNREFFAKNASATINTAQIAVLGVTFNDSDLNGNRKQLTVMPLLDPEVAKHGVVYAQATTIDVNGQPQSAGLFKVNYQPINKNVNKLVIASNTYNWVDLNEVAVKKLENGDFNINFGAIVLPKNIKVLFSIPYKNVTSLDNIALRKYLADNYSKNTPANAFPAIEAYLAPEDEANYILSQDKRATLTVTTEINSASLALINNLKPLANYSNNESVVWPEVPTIPGVAEISFYYASDASKTLTEIQALPTTDWSKTLPIAISSEFDLRSLWARITLESGYYISTPFIDLTTSSQIREVKSVIPSSTYATLDFSGVVIKTLEDGDYSITEDVTPPSNTKILFAIESKRIFSLDKTTLKKYLTDNHPNNPAGEGLPTIYVYLAPTNKNKYVLAAEKISVVEVVAAVTRLSEISEADKALIASMLHADASSTHKAVKWDLVEGLSNQVQGLMYSFHDYADANAAKAAPDSDWVSKPLTSVDFTPELRHLWVKVLPSSKFILDNPYLDVTESSLIQKIALAVDKRNEPKTEVVKNSSNEKSENSSKSTGLSTSTIVGISVGSILGFIVLGLLAWYLIFRSRSRSRINKNPKTD